MAGTDLGSIVAHLKLDMQNWNNNLNVARDSISKIDDDFRGLTKAGDTVASIGKKFTAGVTAPIVGAGVASAKMAMDFETAFAGVRKTVDATEAEYKQLEEGIRNMSKQMPQSASEIAGVAESAGQLGIAKEDVLDFTKVMVELGDTTNLTSEEAASALAQFANVTQMSMNDIDRLGSTIVDLGNNLATTEADIVSMGQRMAATGSQIGMSEAQIMSWSGAMSSVGITAEVGGTSFNKFGSMVQIACETGGEQLQKLADVAGMTTADFKKKFEEDASGALQAFIKGLSESESKGKSVISVLGDLGIQEDGMRRTLSSLAGGYDTLNKALDVGNEAWKKNTALQAEAEKKYATTESQLKILKNTFADIGITIGGVLLPYIQSFADALGKVATWLSKVNDSQWSWIINIGLVVASIGPLLMIMGSLMKAVTTMKAGWVMLTGIFSGIPKIIGMVASAWETLQIWMLYASDFITATLIPALKALWTFLMANPIVLVITLIGALVAAFIYCWNNVEGFKEFWIGLWDTIKQACIDGWNAVVEFFTVTMPQWFDMVIEWFKKLPETIFYWLCYVIIYVAMWIGQMYNKAVEAGSEFVRGVIDWIKQLPGRVWQWLCDTFNRVVQWAGDMKDKAQQAGSEFVRNLIDWIKQLPGRLWNLLLQAIGKVISFASDMKRKASETAQGFCTNIMNGLANLPSRLYNAGADMVRGLINGIKSKAGALWSAAQSLATDAYNAVASKLKINSPSKVFRDKIGSAIPEGLAVGVKIHTNEAISAVKRMSQSLVDSFNPKLSKSLTIDASRQAFGDYAVLQRLSAIENAIKSQELIDYAEMEKAFKNGAEKVESPIYMDKTLVGQKTAEPVRKANESVRKRLNRLEGVVE